MRSLKIDVGVVRTICAHSAIMISLVEVSILVLTWLWVIVLISDGQQHRCNWLSAVCSKDPSCKDLYDDREQKCTSVFSWTEDRMAPPKCTDECKEAHARLMKHKIWKGNAACDCGNFFGGRLTQRGITQREQCIRRRINMMMHCSGRFESAGCPKG